MPSKSGLTLVKKPRLTPSAQHAALRAGVAQRLGPVLQQHGVDPRKRIVANWQAQHRPEFEGRVIVKAKEIIFEVLITNADKALSSYGGTVASLWRWFVGGTKAHTIVPRFVTILTFVIDGARHWAQKVRHPGTRGTGDDKRINRGLERRVTGAIDVAYKRELKELERKNRA